MKFLAIIFFIFFSTIGANSLAQNGEEFSNIIELKHTKIKNQGITGTCWAFATMSFLESEILRINNKKVNLSEMYIVHYVFQQKMEDYVRFHGHINFTQGGQAHDVLNVMRTEGLVLQEHLDGKVTEQGYYNHNQLEKELETIVKPLIKKEKIEDDWLKDIRNVLDKEIEKLPKTVTYDNKNFTPYDLMKNFGINPDNYVEITSYLHHPFYEQFVLELPDNWSHDRFYNVPVDELVEIIDSALYNGYTVAWDADVSETGFAFGEGTATLPEEKKGGKKLEKATSQLNRQITFNNYETTDDHLMHIVGLARDMDGNKFYYVKNSWGTSNKYKGYLYASVPYVRLKTIAILVHKEAIPKHIAKKMF